MPKNSISRFYGSPAGITVLTAGLFVLANFALALLQSSLSNGYQTSRHRHVVPISTVATMVIDAPEWLRRDDAGAREPVYFHLDAVAGSASVAIQPMTSSLPITAIVPIQPLAMGVTSTTGISCGVIPALANSVVTNTLHISLVIASPMGLVLTDRDGGAVSPYLDFSSPPDRDSKTIYVQHALADKDSHSTNLQVVNLSPFCPPTAITNIVIRTETKTEAYWRTVAFQILGVGGPLGLAVTAIIGWYSRVALSRGHEESSRARARFRSAVHANLVARNSKLDDRKLTTMLGDFWYGGREDDKELRRGHGDSVSKFAKHISSSIRTTSATWVLVGSLETVMELKQQLIDYGLVPQHQVPDLEEVCFALRECSFAINAEPSDNLEPPGFTEPYWAGIAFNLVWSRFDRRAFREIIDMKDEKPLKDFVLGMAVCHLMLAEQGDGRTNRKGYSDYVSSMITDTPVHSRKSDEYLGILGRAAIKYLDKDVDKAIAALRDQIAYSGTSTDE